jgi:hypothetical protein
MRAAVVGGGAYLAGKSRARRQDEQAQLEEEQNARINGLEQQPPAQPAPAASSPMVDQLNKLAELHQKAS